VKNYTGNNDFQVIYRMTVEYDDTNPVSSNSTALGFSVTKTGSNNNTSSTGQIGEVTTYQVTV
jgi:hypothetical protein